MMWQPEVSFLVNPALSVFSLPWEELIVSSWNLNRENHKRAYKQLPYSGKGLNSQCELG
jgi:hypothetical protein